MIIKTLGAICIFGVCGGFGWMLAYAKKKEIDLIEQFIRILLRLENEIHYHLKSIPDIFRHISAEEKGELSEFLLQTAVEMENQIQPDVARCMAVSATGLAGMPNSIIKLIENLGNELGRYEVEGQISGIEQVRMRAEELRNELSRDRIRRIRGYQTLGLCVGAALVIIFI